MECGAGRRIIYLLRLQFAPILIAVNFSAALIDVHRITSQRYLMNGVMNKWIKIFKCKADAIVRQLNNLLFPRSKHIRRRQNNGRDSNQIVQFISQCIGCTGIHDWQNRRKTIEEKKMQRDFAGCFSHSKTLHLFCFVGKNNVCFIGVAAGLCRTAYALAFFFCGLAWPPSRNPLRKRRRTIFR